MLLCLCGKVCCVALVLRAIGSSSLVLYIRFILFSVFVKTGFRKTQINRKSLKAFYFI